MSNSILLLTEKYRPNTLADIKGNPSTISMLDSWVKARNIRNSYFFGPPGCGKTSAARCIARELYGEDASDWMWREYHAAMLNKEEICSTIKRWVTSWVGVEYWEGYGTPGFRVNLPFPSYRLIILDECEKMASINETLLRKLLEDYQGYVRFILIYNDISKMSALIMSRLTDVPFSFLTSHDIRNAISNIIQNERATNRITQTQIDQISR